MRSAWHVVEPGKDYVHDRHIDAICDHLEAVSQGDIRDLIINIPPRHSKSIIVAVMWPCWLWTTEPETQWLYSSYAQSLSTRDSLKCRRLIESPWFQNFWGDKFKLTSDQNTKQRFDNDKAGYRIATSVGGATTGEGGDIIVVDDPHSADEAQSDAYRESVLEWWDNTMSTRLNDPKTGRRIVIMQRFHQADLTGHLLAKKEGWVHLRLPAEYEPENRCVTVDLKHDGYRWTDWRKDRNELLAPTRFGTAELEKLKSGMSPYAVAGQLQQRPSPAGGGVFKRDWFKLYPRGKFPPLHYVVCSYDGAYTENTLNDPCAGSIWGIWRENEKAPYKLLLLECWSKHFEYHDFRARVVSDYQTEFGEPHIPQHSHFVGQAADLKAKRPDLILIEAKANGLVLAGELRRMNMPVRTYDPGKMDKVQRAHLVSHLVYNGLVYLPESEADGRPGKPMTWIEPFLDEVTAFPNAEHDDLTDTFTQVLTLLRDQGFLKNSRPPLPDEDQRPPVQDKGNPYAV